MKYLVTVLLLATATPPALAQNQTVIRGSDGRTIGTATTDSQGTTIFRNSGGTTTGTASRDSQGTTTFRNSGGTTTGTATSGAYKLLYTQKENRQ